MKSFSFFCRTKCLLGKRDKTLNKKTFLFSCVSWSQGAFHLPTPCPLLAAGLLCKPWVFCDWHRLPEGTLPRSPLCV